MTSIYWNGNNADASFNNGADWVGGTAPGAGDTAVIVQGTDPYSEPRDVYVEGAASLGGLRMLTVGYTFGIDGGPFSIGSGGVSLGENTMIVGEGQTLNLNGGLVTGVLFGGNGGIVSLDGKVILNGVDFQAGGIDSELYGVFLTKGVDTILDGSTSAGAFSNGGIVQIDQNTALTLEGSINNHSGGTLNNGASGAGFQVGGGELLVGAGGVTLSTRGAISMSATGVIEGASAGATLTNVDNSIYGLGTISGLHNLINEAQGQIEAYYINGGSLMIDLGGGTLTNSGIVVANTVNPNYQMKVIIEDTVVVGTSGTIVSSYGSQVQFDGADIEGGTLSNKGVFKVVGTGNVFDGSAGVGSITNHGSIQIGTGSGLTLEGTIRNLASFGYGGDLAVNGGTLILNGADVQGGELSTSGAGLTLVAGAGNVLDGSAGVGSFTNHGAIDIAAASALTLKGLIDDSDGNLFVDSANLVNDGTLVGGRVGVYVTTPGATITNYGAISGATYSVTFATAGEVLVVEAGSTLTGAARGLADTLMFGAGGGVGTVTGLGSGAFSGSVDAAAISGFSTYGIQTGAAWTLTGSNILVSGDTMNVDGVLTVDGSLTNAGFINGGMTLAAGGYLLNQTRAAIYSPASNAVTGAGAGASVVNHGTLEGNTGHGGVFLNGGALTNGTASDTTAFISGYFGGVYVANAAGTVINFGTITAFGSPGDGVELLDGGSLANAASGVITGAAGVSVDGAAGTVVNSGSIEAGLAGDGVSLLDGGAATNTTSGVITAGYRGVYISAAPGTVTNDGTIETGRSGTGVKLDNGGLVTNKDGDSITGGRFGVLVEGGAGTLDNSGVVGSSGIGVELGSGGQVTNAAAGTISGGLFGLYIAPAAGTVTNYGLIYGGLYSIRFESAGGVLVVEAGSTLTGSAQGYEATLAFGAGGGEGVLAGLGGGALSGSAGALAITGFSTYEVQTGANWTLTGGNTVISGDTLTADGVLIVAGSLVNNGLINGEVTLAAGGYLLNQAQMGAVSGVQGGAGWVVNEGSVTGSAGYGVDLHGGGSVTNMGSRLIDGGQGGAYIGAVAGTVVNFGLMAGTSGDGVALGDGGSVANSGSITGGRFGVYIGNAAGTVGNYGIIAGSAIAGVALHDGGSITNGAEATITGGGYGVLVQGAAGTVDNDYGTITGSGVAGVALHDGGSVTNTFGASIHGVNCGVLVQAGDATITNYGVISGGTDSVEFASGGDVLVLEAGSTLNGKAVGDGGVLAFGPGGGYGVLAGLGGPKLSGSAGPLAVSGFSTYEIEAGAYWTLKATNAVAGGETLNVEGYLTVFGALTNKGLLEATGAGELLLDNVSVVGRSGGTISAADGSNIELEAARIDGGTLTTVGSGLIEIEKLNSVLDGTAGSVTNAGELLIDQGASLILIGVIDNTGTIALFGNGTNHASLAVGAGGATLKGGGQVTLTAGQLRGSVSRPTLTNVDDTISGGGSIVGPLTLVNQAGGVIDADRGAMTLKTGDTVTNDGLIEATGSTGLLLVDDSTIDSAGGGQVEAGKQIQLDEATLLGGSLTIDKGGLVISKAIASTVDLKGGTVNNAGTLEGAGGGLTIDGDVADTGLVIAETGSLTITGDVTGPGKIEVFGKGTLEIDGVQGGTIAFAGGGAGRLVLGDGAAFGGTITGLSRTGLNSIDLKDIVYSSGDTAIYVANKNVNTGGVLTVSDGIHTATLKLAGANYGSSANFKLSQDSGTGTIVIDPPTTAAHAFVAAMASFADPAAAYTAGTIGPAVDQPMMTAPRAAPA